MFARTRIIAYIAALINLEAPDYERDTLVLFHALARGLRSIREGLCVGIKHS